METRRFRITSGKHYEGGRCYGPGEVIESLRPMDEIFLNKFEALDPAPVEEEIAVPAEQTGLKLKVVRRGSRFDVVNETTGVRLNDKTLTKAEKDELLADYPNAEVDEPKPAAGPQRTRRTRTS